MVHSFLRLKKHHVPSVVLILSFVLLGACFRLHNISFGLPHSFHADEPELVEPAIKYTYEIRNIIKTTEYFRLIPVSYVYGTVPTYAFTLLTMLYSKANNLFQLSFAKADIYIFLRTIMSLVSLLLIPLVTEIYKIVSPIRMRRHSIDFVALLFFTAFNWKLIVHAHYINSDIVVTLFLTLSFLFFGKYLSKKSLPSAAKYTLYAALFFGLAVGTKITALLSAPLFLMFYFKRKDVTGVGVFILVVFGVFVLTNPFSWVFAHDFAQRLLEFRVKENGFVFDSVDANPFKYLLGLGTLLSPFVFFVSILGIFVSYKNKYAKDFGLFLLLNVCFYLVFFSLGTRRVDRWLLPILPIFFVYASIGLLSLKNLLNRYAFFLLLIVLCSTYLYYPGLLLQQYAQNTPKSSAYIWARGNIDPLASKLLISKEGLDPLGKLSTVKKLTYQVYVSKGAQFDFPPDPLAFDYVILSSKPMDIYKKPIIKSSYPGYYSKWANFETTVQNKTNFELIASFSTPKPNLTNVADVFIYKRNR